ncbi:MAG: hypothetical protein LBT79_01730 [Elusimicrobiota bacterium]|jgi:uncharacterized protein HemY|nr:hypothetical protein [Elusimicrobiota bacterium]
MKTVKIAVKGLLIISVFPLVVLSEIKEIIARIERTWRKVARWTKTQEATNESN